MAALAVVLVAAGGAGSRAQPAPDTAPAGLHPPSSPAALSDPLAQRCRALALARDANSGGTRVEMAANTFEMQEVFDAVAVCRQALRRHPGDRALTIAENAASFCLSLMTLGLKAPDTDEAALSQALTEASGKEPLEGLEGQALGFYIGSAFEYGIGTKPDRARALRWYAAAAAAGDPIAERERARLQAAAP